jgi:hypothetical protein
MSKVTRISTLFFAAILLFISIHIQNYTLLVTSDLQKSGSANSEYYFSSLDSSPLFVIRKVEKLINSAQDLPSYGSKVNLTDLYSNRLSNEIRLFNVNSRYLSFSGITDRNFTNVEIVFPFHSFW